MLSSKPVRLVVLLAIVAATALAGAPRANAAGDQWLYDGTATLRVGLVDAYGRSAGTQTFRTNVEAVVATSHRRENNPFHLAVQSTPLVNAPGEFGISSGLAAEGTFFQYWSYQMVDRSNTRFEGELTDNHTAAAIALNVLTLPAEIAPNIVLPFPLAMDDGCEIVGEVDQSELRIGVRGNTTDGVHPFELQIVAERTR